MTTADTEILTVEDLAKLFGCDKETAAARLTSGDFPGVKVGRGWIIPRQALFERLNEKAREEAAARRNQRTELIEASQRQGNKKIVPARKSIPATPEALISKPATTRGGRARRTPPPLPSIDNFTKNEKYKIHHQNN